MAMLRSLIRRRAEAPRPSAAPRTAPDTVVWAFGDVHGRSDLLGPLLAAIMSDLERCDAERRVIVGLGDYVDRGPDSPGVIDLLIRAQLRSDLEVRLLRGNHEAFLDRFLHRPDAGPIWCEHGGRATLNAYGVAAPTFREDAASWREASIALSAALPAVHRAFLDRLELSFESGDYFFCHAGARPGVPLQRQSPEDLLWIRQEFLGAEERFERIIVHGHTPTPELHADHRRIGLDTGAYATGVLSAMRFQDADRAALQVRVVGGKVAVKRA
ncbi:metallophosphoesterase family protein [Brevundimonas sp. VNH65]|uniref:metallophosphoesterase family protein n=1 Tax=Brevundimonas sp. VNH65 TaxID=3400917 RepID=UPI003C058211